MSVWNIFLYIFMTRINMYMGVFMYWNDVWKYENLHLSIETLWEESWRESNLNSVLWVGMAHLIYSLDGYIYHRINGQPGFEINGNKWQKKCKETKK